MTEEQPKPFPSLADARFVVALVVAGGALSLAVAWVALPAARLALGGEASAHALAAVEVAKERGRELATPARAGAKRAARRRNVSLRGRVSSERGRSSAAPLERRAHLPTPVAARTTAPAPPDGDPPGPSSDAGSTSSSNPAPPPPPPPPPASQPPPTGLPPVDVPKVEDVVKVVPPLPQLPPPPAVTVTTPELP